MAMQFRYMVLGHRQQDTGDKDAEFRRSLFSAIHHTMHCVGGVSQDDIVNDNALLNSQRCLRHEDAKETRGTNECLERRCYTLLPLVFRLM